MGLVLRLIVCRLCVNYTQAERVDSQWALSLPVEKAGKWIQLMEVRWRLFGTHHLDQRLGLYPPVEQDGEGTLFDSGSRRRRCVVYLE